MTYKEEIQKANYTIEEYLRKAKLNASKNGYNPKLLKISDNPKYKLTYDGRNFGSSINNDYIIYLMKYKNKEISLKDAKQHRTLYLARARNIKGDWKINPTSKNNLAIKILWNG